MKNILVEDCKRNKLIQIKIDLDENIFIVVPEIIDQRFNYLRQRLMDIRKIHMQKYLEDKVNYLMFEKHIYDEMREVLIKEMTYIYRKEGIMYYTR